MINRLRSSSNPRITAIATATDVEFDSLIDLHVDSLAASITHTNSNASTDEAVKLRIKTILEDSSPLASRRIHSILRQEEFASWLGYPSAKCGIKIISEEAAASSFLSRPGGLSDTQWTTGLQLRWGTLPLRGAPGNGPGNCRFCNNSRETAPHVLGGCPSKFSRQYLARHDAVLDAICTQINKNDVDNRFEILKNPILPREIGQHHKPDLIIQRRDKSAIFVLDVTVRTEIDDASREAALSDKAEKYGFLNDYYQNLGFQNTEVRGLWFGARGALHIDAIRFLRTHFAIPKAFFEKVSREALRHSIGIIHEVLRNKPG